MHNHWQNQHTPYTTHIPGIQHPQHHHPTTTPYSYYPQQTIPHVPISYPYYIPTTIPMVHPPPTLHYHPLYKQYLPTPVPPTPPNLQPPHTIYPPLIPQTFQSSPYTQHTRSQHQHSGQYQYPPTPTHAPPLQVQFVPAYQDQLIAILRQNSQTALPLLSIQQVPHLYLSLTASRHVHIIYFSLSFVATNYAYPKILTSDST